MGVWSNFWRSSIAFYFPLNIIETILLYLQSIIETIKNVFLSTAKPDVWISNLVSYFKSVNMWCFGHDFSLK